MHMKTKGTLRGRNASSALASPPEQITRLLLLFTNTLDHLYGIGKYHIPFTCAETHRNIERRALVVASACMSWVHNCLSWHHRAFQGDPHLNVKSTQAATGPLSRDTCIPEGLFGLRWKACVRVNRFENLSKGCLYRGYLLCDIFFLPYYPAWFQTVWILGMCTVCGQKIDWKSHNIILQSKITQYTKIKKISTTCKGKDNWQITTTWWSRCWDYQTKTLKQLFKVNTLDMNGKVEHISREIKLKK